MSDEAVDRLKKYLDAVDESHRTPFQKSVSYTDHDAGTFAWEVFRVSDLRALLAAHDALTEKCKAQMEALREWDERVGRLQDANDALTAEVTVSEAVMSAMEQAVASCADQAAKGMPPGTWCVDYAGILSRSTAALRAATPEVPRG